MADLLTQETRHRIPRGCLPARKDFIRGFLIDFAIVAGIID
jgi:hypothetical protein